MSNKEKEFEVLDALQDMFYSMAERMSADHVWSAKELKDMGDILFSGERNRLSDYIDRLIKLTKQPEGFTLVENGVLEVLNGNIETLSSNLHIAETAVFEQMIEIGDLTIEIDILKNELKDK